MKTQMNNTTTDIKVRKAQAKFHASILAHRGVDWKENTEKINNRGTLSNARVDSGWADSDDETKREQHHKRHKLQSSTSRISRANFGSPRKISTKHQFKTATLSKARVNADLADFDNDDTNTQYHSHISFRKVHAEFPAGILAHRVVDRKESTPQESVPKGNDALNCEEYSVVQSLKPWEDSVKRRKCKVASFGFSTHYTSLLYHSDV